MKIKFLLLIDAYIIFIVENTYTSTKSNCTMEFILIVLSTLCKNKSVMMGLSQSLNKLYNISYCSNEANIQRNGCNKTILIQT